jgi:MtN3 and saliva related transmembrane protein
MAVPPFFYDPFSGLVKRMSIGDSLGFVAGACTTLAFLPQVLQVWRTRSAADISLGMYSIFLAGTILWLAYGISSGSAPLIVTNSVTLVLSGAVLTMKLRFARAPGN